MTPARWQTVKELFDQLQALPPAERHARLAQAAAGDPALQREVAGLLDADGASGDFLESAPWNDVRMALEARLTATPDHIGPYRIRRELGRGGMGVVFLASRDDSAYEKDVAIKIVRAGFDGELLRRFQHERQILANLDHPNIARLLDGGTTEQGSPYLVMEYVDGEPITAYCDRLRLPLAERLLLFQAVCAAVHHAHQNLIIHRDLKPANILIARDGVPKLLDFGIAKLLAAAGAPRGLTLTMDGAQPMTPDYASPEQVRGGTLTTATDIYTLGLILYELVSGSQAYGAARGSRVGIERAILQGTPVRPSEQARRNGPAASEARRTTPEKLSRALAGNIDNIVLMAMRNEPERRYVSAAALTDDIRRHLEHFPVLARRDTFGYRAATFVRRRTRLVAGAGLAVLALLVATGVAAWQAHQANAARAVAERRFSDARRFSMSLLEELFRSGEREAASVRQASTQRTVEYLDRLAAEAGSDPQVQEDLAHAYWYMGVVQSDTWRVSTGDMAGGLSAYQKAAGILERLTAADPANANLATWLSVTYQNRALALLPVDVASSLEDQRRYVAVAERLARMQPGDPAAQMELAGAIRLLGERLGHPYYGNVGDTAAARREIERATKIVEQWSLKLPPSHQDNIFGGLGSCSTVMAGMVWAMGDVDGAIALQRRGIDFYEGLLRELPNRTDVQAELGLIYARMAGFLHEAGRHADAVGNIRRATGILEPLYRRDPDSLAFYRNLARTYNQAGDVWLAREPQRALRWYEDAERLGEGWIARQRNDQEARERLGESKGGVARALAALGRGSAAAEKSRRAVEIAESLVKLDPRNAHYAFSLMLAHRDRGGVLHRAGQTAAAAEEYRKGLAVIEPLATGDRASWLMRRALLDLRARLGF